MVRWMPVGLALVVGLALAGPAGAQESKAAQASRKKLQQKVDLDLKEVGTKAFFEELNLELNQPITFRIDNASGVSNNSKMSYKGKGVTVEKILNELADKYDWGWVVISNAGNNKVDGSVTIRKAKGKERGYEAGKEPKKGAALDPADAPLRSQMPAVLIATTEPILAISERRALR